MLNTYRAAIPLGLKILKYFVDSTFRDTVVPVPGSVLYCDLWVAVEHSGIYVEAAEISNIVVDGLAESTVCLSNPGDFTSKSILGKKIYVSCDKHGAVGHTTVANRAEYGCIEKCSAHQSRRYRVAPIGTPSGSSEAPRPGRFTSAQIHCFIAAAPPTEDHTALGCLALNPLPPLIGHLE